MNDTVKTLYEQYGVSLTRDSDGTLKLYIPYESYRPLEYLGDIEAFAEGVSKEQDLKPQSLNQLFLVAIQTNLDSVLYNQQAHKDTLQIIFRLVAQNNTKIQDLETKFTKLEEKITETQFELVMALSLVLIVLVSVTLWLRLKK